MKNEINAKELIEILKITPPEQNIMLSGKHGIGKSEIITSFFERQKIPVITLFLGQLSDPGDLIGLPHFNEKTGLTDFMPPYWFPIDGKPVVLFLDELNRARPEILQTIMDLALNKKLAGRKLPEGTRIVSAVNSGDEYQLTDLDPALVSRFNIYNFVPDVEDWILWAKKKGIDSRIISFIKNHPEMLDGNPENSESEENLLKTPDRRGWEKVSKLIKSVEVFKPFHVKVISGIVGRKAALDFVTSQNNIEMKKVSASEILTQGENVFPSLTSFSLTDYSSLINSIFEILDSPKHDPEKDKTYSKNLESFVSFLKENNRNEQLGFFSSLYTSGQFKNAVNFMMDNAMNVVMEIASFIGKN